jgi:co-chaperonin GroES (HSP10)
MTIQVPRHIAQERIEELRREAIERHVKAGPPVSQAVKALSRQNFANRRLIIEQLSKYQEDVETGVIEEPLQPIGWSLMLLTIVPQNSVELEGKDGQKLDFQIFDRNQERERATPVGVVLDMGPECYANRKRFSSNWCDKGDVVFFQSYSGNSVHLANGQTILFMNDDLVIGKYGLNVSELLTKEEEMINV